MDQRCTAICHLQSGPPELKSIHVNTRKTQRHGHQIDQAARTQPPDYDRSKSGAGHRVGRGPRHRGRRRDRRARGRGHQEPHGRAAPADLRPQAPPGRHPQGRGPTARPARSPRRRGPTCAIPARSRAPPMAALWAAPWTEAASKHYLAYVGTYTGPQSKGIYAFRFDADTGKLDPAGLVGELERPSFLVIHPNRKYLYAVSELGNSSVTGFEIDAGSGKLISELRGHQERTPQHFHSMLYVCTFTPDGHISVSWFRGPFEQFVERCRPSFGAGHTWSRHHLFAPTVTVRGDRALAGMRPSGGALRALPLRGALAHERRGGLAPPRPCLLGCGAARVQPAPVVRRRV